MEDNKYNSINSKFLFIVVHKYNKSENQITSTIKDVFEINKDNKFVLSKTYEANNKSEYDKLFNMNIDNYITTDGNIFQSKININNSERI